MYKPAERNYDGVRWESLRREIEKPYNEFHDALSAAYYDGGILDHPMTATMGYRARTVDFGRLKKEAPDKAREIFQLMHDYNDGMRQVAFHEANLARPLLERAPEEEYNQIRDEHPTMTRYEYHKSMLAEIGGLLAKR